LRSLSPNFLHEADLVVFAVEPARSGFIVALEPMRADDQRILKRAGNIIAVSLGTLVLIQHAAQPGMKLAAIQGAHVEFPDDERFINARGHDHIVQRELVEIEADHVVIPSGMTHNLVPLGGNVRPIVVIEAAADMEFVGHDLSGGCADRVMVFLPPRRVAAHVNF
jgi:hypothetical protein